MPAVRLSDLKSRRAATLDQLRQLVETAETAGRDFDEVEAARYEELRGQERQLAAQIERREQIEALDRTAAPGEGGAVEWRSMMARYSLFAAIRHQLDPRAEAGLEREVAAEIARQRGRAARGFWVPSEALSIRADLAPVELRASAYATGAGNAAIRPVDYRPDQLIPAFKAALIARRLGVRTLAGLQGAAKVALPKSLGGSTVGWVAEDGEVPVTASTYDKVEVEPHTLGAQTSISRRMLLTTTPQIEALARADIAAAMAQEVDRAFLRGTGGETAEPKGLLSYGAPDGLNIVTMGTPTRAKLLAMRQAPKLLNANAPGSWLFSAKVEGALMNVATAAAGEPAPTHLIDPPNAAGVLLGSPYVVSNLAPDDLGAGEDTSLIAFGDWSEAIIASWSGLDVVLDPYTLAGSGAVRVVVLQDLDFAFRRLQALAVATDVTTA